MDTLARTSRHLTVEARNRPAITSLRLLAVLNVGFKYARIVHETARRAARVLGWHVGWRLAGRGPLGTQEIGDGGVLSHGRQVRIVECQRPVSGIQFYGPAKASMDARGVSFYGL